MPTAQLRRVLLRKVLPAMVPIALSAIAADSAAAAAAADYPFCLRGCDFGAGDCSFLTYRQCLATASGREAWCDVNPAFQQGRAPQAVRYSRRRF